MLLQLLNGLVVAGVLAVGEGFMEFGLEIQILYFQLSVLFFSSFELLDE